VHHVIHGRGVRAQPLVDRLQRAEHHLSLFDRIVRTADHLDERQTGGRERDGPDLAPVERTAGHQGPRPQDAQDGAQVPVAGQQVAAPVDELDRVRAFLVPGPRRVDGGALEVLQDVRRLDFRDFSHLRGPARVLSVGHP